VVVPNCPHHIVQRGHNRNAVFVGDEDYTYYLENLIQAKRDFEYRRLGYNVVMVVGIGCSKPEKSGGPSRARTGDLAIMRPSVRVVNTTNSTGCAGFLIRSYEIPYHSEYSSYRFHWFEVAS